MTGSVSTRHPLYAPLSVISAKVKLALRCKSILSENTSVLRARSGSPEKKSVSPRWYSVSRRHSDRSHWGHDKRFRDTGAGRPRPPARCQREPARTDHRGISLARISIGSSIERVRAGQIYLRSTMSCRRPLLKWVLKAVDGDGWLLLLLWCRALWAVVGREDG